VAIHAVKRDSFGGGLLFLFLVGNTEYSFIHERRDQSAADRAKPIDPMVPPLAVPQCRRERSRGIHAATGVRPDRVCQQGHRKTKLDWHRVRILLVSRIPDSARDQHQNEGRGALEDQALNRGYISM